MVYTHYNIATYVDICLFNGIYKQKIFLPTFNLKYLRIT